MAPLGLLANSTETAFELGCELAALTHGHPTGYLAAGSFSAIISCLRQGMTLEGAIGTAIDLLRMKEGSMECMTLLQLALALPAKGKATPETIEKTGEGWTAGEALAIALYSALVGEGDFRKGVLFAVNHSGDSDSTGSIAGNILGTMLGDKLIPERWPKHLELRDVILKLAKDLHTGFEKTDRWWKKYPGF